MKANKLMIGDFVTRQNHENKAVICKIIGLSKNSISVEFDNGSRSMGASEDSINPISLTPEILEKNGMNPFDIDKLTEKATAKWWHKGGDFFIKQYHFKHHNFKPTYSFGCNNHTLIEGIEYVHQLQHALKLCGIEKQIEL